MFWKKLKRKVEAVSLTVGARGGTVWLVRALIHHVLRRWAVLREPFPFAPSYHQPTLHHPLSHKQTIDSRFHFSRRSSYGLLVLKFVLQLPTNHQQRFGRIQEAHKERPTCTSTRRQTPILQHSQRNSRRPSAANPGARSVPK